MLQEIKEQLAYLEREKNLKVLMAVESGSRAWGFPSPDSDYDVRIIYQRPEDWYLTIGERKDTIDYFHGELLDISGWDLRKALKLLSKSNATPAEWSQSPIVYQEQAGFRAQLFGYVQEYFNPVHTLNHYRGIALNSYKSMADDGIIKLKKLFYVLRPILAAEWILAHQSVPPMEIQPLLGMLKDDALKQHIVALIDLKAKAAEDYQHQIAPDTRSFIEEALERVKNADLPKCKQLESEPLYQFIRQQIRLKY